MNPDHKQKSETGNDSAQKGYPLDAYSVQPKSDSSEEKSPYYKSAAPGISLPKGGGALKSIDEKFTVNAVNGTASLQVALPLSPARNGFTPSLSLQYNSGSGNSEFGLGWSLSLPSIQRRTDKKLPRYDDANESDVFLMAGAEDLVPELAEIDGVWKIKRTPSGNYIITRYMPRIEGLFARIELIREIITNDTWWRVTTKDNIVTFYGLTAEGRLSDPDNEQRVFKWLPQIMYDNKGNVQWYMYVPEDTSNIPVAVHERNRKNGTAAFANQYLKQVNYCNNNAYAGPTDPYKEDFSFSADFKMTAVLDYVDSRTDPRTTVDDGTLWSVRSDPFSDFHAGFEVRTYRRCRRVLMYHLFEEAGGEALVRSLDLAYNNDVVGDEYTEADYITSIIQKGYSLTSSYIKSLPALTLDYEPLQWDNTIQNVSQENTQNAPQGLTGPYQWTDLWGEGLPGILTEQSQGWFYKTNLGNGNFTPMLNVAPKPSFVGLGGTLQMQDLDADGRRQIVSMDRSLPGYFELDDDQEWLPFRAFKEKINVDWDSPYTKSLDLDGDGRPDVLIVDDVVWTWYHNKGTEGYTNGGYASTVWDEEKGPRLVLNDPIQRIFLADINGDGLTDLVRICNGNICYWPNKGYGKFGAKVTMSNAPLFDRPDIYNPQYITLADISGTGAVDLIYLGQNKCTAWVNLAGNAWSAATDINTLPSIDTYSKIAVLDFLGSGTACIVWSSPLPQYANAPMRYIDLMGGRKPYLLKTYSNSMGKTVQLTYKHSTQYYLEDKLAGTPWVTRLPFAVHCLSGVTTTDAVSQTTYTQSYSYHHGYYDHPEREFRGFGRVDAIDTDTAVAYDDGSTTENDLNQAPVLTKTWYHTGAWMQESTLLEEFAKEYFPLPGWTDIGLMASYPAGLGAQEIREAHRALKGQPLRQEVYALDNDPTLGDNPYTITAYNYAVQLVQALETNRYASFYSYQQQKVTFQCERMTADPRILHELTLDIDLYGNVLQAAKVAYARPLANATGPDVVKTVQTTMLMTCTTTSYTNDQITDAQYRLRVPYEATVEQLEGFTPTTSLWEVATLKTDIDTAAVVPVHGAFCGGMEKSIIQANRILYLDDDAVSILNLGQVSLLGLQYQQYTLAYTDLIMLDGLDNNLDGGNLTDAGYTSNSITTQFPSTDDPSWFWLGTGTIDYGSTPAVTFYMPMVYTDLFGNNTTITYLYSLLPVTVTDAVGNVTTVNHFDWACLHPVTMTDPNHHVNTMRYDALGMLVAVALEDGGDSINIDYEDDTAIAAFWADPVGQAVTALGSCTWRCVYDLTIQPIAVAMIGREQHTPEDMAHNALVRISHTDGLGRLAMEKVLDIRTSDPGYPPAVWITSGKTVYNNKGNVVMQYEPYFSSSWIYSADAGVGVTSRLHYDPLGRVRRTDMPDGTYTYTVWDAWMQQVYDAGDTALHSKWYHDAMNSGDAMRIDAAGKSAAYADTPVIHYFDTLGRTFYTDNNGLTSYTELDLPGNRLTVYDGRNIMTLQYVYDLLNAPIKEVSKDGGTRLNLPYADGQTNTYQDPEGMWFSVLYDALRRPTTKTSDDKTLENWVYGETAFAPNPAGANMATRLYQHFDGAGLVQYDSYDFKGNVVSQTRKFVATYDSQPDWSSATLETAHYTTLYTYDALNRPVTVTTPDSAVTSYGYDAGGRLYSVQVNSLLPANTPIINRILYNAKNQRTYIGYNNNTSTVYSYDPDTFRITSITTTRSTDSVVLQDLRYWYDSMGNITWQRDNAQQDVFFNNGMTTPDNEYTYDNTYRLIQASGREHAGNGYAPKYMDKSRSGIMPIPVADTNKMQNYTQYYTYDASGNMMEMQHVVAAGGTSGWTRTFTIDTVSNRLMGNSIGSKNPIAETYKYDSRGNIVSGFNHLYLPVAPVSYQDSMVYNEENRLEKVIDATGAITSYYQYDGSGQRVRKVVVDTGGGITQVRKYVGQWEVYTRSNSTTLLIQRETLHVMDDSSRVALIDTPVAGSSIGSEVQLLRYQYSNHLSTATLELDSAGAIISYEEYYAFGSTSFQAGRTLAEVSLKRYRYTGKERDEETGFYYCGARYYVPWLCRWMAVDPMQSSMAEWSPYNYSYDNPIKFTDKTGLQPEEGQRRVTYTSAYHKDADGGGIEYTPHVSYWHNGGDSHNKGWYSEQDYTTNTKEVMTGLIHAIGQNATGKEAGLLHLNSGWGGAAEIAKADLAAAEFLARNEGNISSDFLHLLSSEAGGIVKGFNFKHGGTQTGRVEPVGDPFTELIGPALLSSLFKGVARLTSEVIASAVAEETVKALGNTTIRNLVAENIGKTLAENSGFESFSAFKRAYGIAGEGQAWHHIVEQTPGNISMFGTQAIHSADNLIRLEHGAGSLHARVSGFYSSKQPFTGGQTVRQWLGGQNFQQQYDFGIKTLKQFGWKP